MRLKAEPHELFHRDRVKGGFIAGIKQKPGDQVIATDTVKRFAKRFNITKDVSSIEPIVKAIKSFRLAILDRGDMEQVYAKRTATDVIHSGRVAILGEEDRKEFGEVMGCVDNGVALVATLKAKGIEARFARHGRHSLVFFDFEGKEYMVDPSKYKRSSKPVEVTEAMRREYEHDAKLGRFAIGRDAWDVDIYGLDDFHRYLR